MSGLMPSTAANPSVQPHAGGDDSASDRARAGSATHPEAGRIGQILVEDGLLSMEQLSKALRIQARLEDRKPIGLLVVELGWVTRPRLELALRRHRHGLSVEGILVERGVIRSGQLARQSVLSELQRLYGVPIASWIGESTKITAAFEALAAETSEEKVTRRRSIQYQRSIEVSDNNRGACDIVDTILTRAVREGAS